MSVDDFNFNVEEMKQFMNLVLKIAFYNLHSSSPDAKGLYESFFAKKNQVEDAT
jgi:hypothetical protein